VKSLDDDDVHLTLRMGRGGYRGRRMKKQSAKSYWKIQRACVGFVDGLYLDGVGKMR
jgi:hypothetical protein